MNSTNEVVVFPFLEEVNKDAYLISISVFTGLSGIVNLFLVVVILLSSTLRSSSKHLIVLAICICTLYISLFTHSFFIQFMYTGKWIHGCELYVALDWKSANIALSISGLLVASLGVDFLVRLLTQKTIVPIILAIVMIIAAVVVSVAVILPLVLTGTFVGDPSMCYYSLEEDYRQSVLALSFFPQGFLMLISIVLVSCSFCKTCKGDVAKTYPFDIVIACVLMILLELPFTVWLVFFSSRIHFRWISILKLLMYIRPCVMSFVWFLCPKTRRGIREVFCCCPVPIEDSERVGQAFRYEMKDTTGIENVDFRM